MNNSSINFGFVCNINGSEIRPATAAELRRSLMLDLANVNYGGAWEDVDGSAVYVTGESAEARAEALGVAVRTVASWPLAGAARDGVAAFVGA